jgi:hypothetical protein
LPCRQPLFINSVPLPHGPLPADTGARPAKPVVSRPQAGWRDSVLAVVLVDQHLVARPLGLRRTRGKDTPPPEQCVSLSASWTWDTGPRSEESQLPTPGSDQLLPESLHLMSLAVPSNWARLKTRRPACPRLRSWSCRSLCDGDVGRAARESQAGVPWQGGLVA